MAIYFEDYAVGDKITTPGRTVTEADISIILGISRYVEPFMIDEEYAKKTIFKTRIAPGRLILLMMGGLVGPSGVFDLETVIALVGINNIKFKNPLRAGDTIKVEVEITDKKETSRPERGVIIHKETCINQREEVLVEMEGTHMVKRKPQE